MSTQNTENPADDLFDFPCDFPIKIMGKNEAQLKAHIAQVTEAQSVETLGLTQRASSKGNYLALTLTVRAHSRAQLDALYQAIGESADVKAML